MDFSVLVLNRYISKPPTSAPFINNLPVILLLNKRPLAKPSADKAQCILTILTAITIVSLGIIPITAVRIRSIAIGANPGLVRRAGEARGTRVKPTGGAGSVVESFGGRVAWVAGPDDGFDGVAGCGGDKWVGVCDSLVGIAAAAEGVVFDLRSLCHVSQGPRRSG